MAQWLGSCTQYLEVTASSPVLSTKLKLFFSRPFVNSLVILVNSQLVCLPSVRIFKPVVRLHVFNIFVSFSLRGVPVNQLGVATCTCKCIDNYKQYFHISNKFLTIRSPAYNKHIRPNSLAPHWGLKGLLFARTLHLH